MAMLNPQTIASLKNLNREEKRLQEKLKQLDAKQYELQQKLNKNQKKQNELRTRIYGKIDELTRA